MYAVKATELFPIRPPYDGRGGAGGGEGGGGGGALSQIWSLVQSKLNPSPKETMEARYVSLFQFLDLGKGDFFFSYTCKGLSSSGCVAMGGCVHMRPFPPIPLTPSHTHTHSWID